MWETFTIIQNPPTGFQRSSWNARMADCPYSSLKSSVCSVSIRCYNSLLQSMPANFCFLSCYFRVNGLKVENCHLDWQCRLQGDIHPSWYDRMIEWPHQLYWVPGWSLLALYWPLVSHENFRVRLGWGAARARVTENSCATCGHSKLVQAVICQSGELRTPGLVTYI